MHVFALALTLGLAQNSQAPNQDFDKDGVPDISDDCPTDPGMPQFSGCPGVGTQKVAKPAAPPAAVKEKVVVQKDTIDLTQSIQFRIGSASVAEESWVLLAALAETVKNLPTNKRLVIEGHTDDVGARTFNVVLSQRRAEAIIAHLVRAGVERSKLEARGYGPDRPLVPNDTDEARAKNRRVEFHIVDAPAVAGP